MTGADAYIETAAMYGGLQLGFGFGAYFQQSIIFTPFALLSIGFAIGGLGLSRYDLLLMGVSVST